MLKPCTQQSAINWSPRDTHRCLHSICNSILMSVVFQFLGQIIIIISGVFGEGGGDDVTTPPDLTVNFWIIFAQFL